MPITLKAARVNKGYTLEEASEMLGVSKATLCKWEKGKTYPTIPHIERIIEKYGVPFDELNFKH